MYAKILYCLLISLLGIHQIYAMNQNEMVSQENRLTDNLNEESDLPIISSERDKLLKQFYNRSLPKLFASSANFYWAPENEYSISTLTPYPYNPYREPGIEKKLFLPTNPIEWENARLLFITHRNRHENIITSINKLIDQFEKAKQLGKTSIKIKGHNPKIIRTLFKRPDKYDTAFFKTHYDQQLIAIQKPTKLTVFEITQEDIVLFQQLKKYHEGELKKIYAFLEKAKEIKNPTKLFEDLQIYTSPDHERALEFFNQITPYFLKGRKSIEQLMDVSFLHHTKTRHSEVIIVDTSFMPSKYITVINPVPDSLTDWKQKAHGTAVTGIISAKEELTQVKGIAPGAKSIFIHLKDLLTPQTLTLIKTSKARVINMSLAFKWPKECAAYFKEKLQNQENINPNSSDLGNQLPSTDQETSKSISNNNTCNYLWELAQIIQEKDMIIVKAAGNEGLQIESVNWMTGETDKDLTNHMIGAQYTGLFQDPQRGSQIDLVHIFKQIPQLENRVILVGNLLPDGVTIAHNSSLPGAFPNDFIYAPGEHLTALYPAIIAKNGPSEIHGILGSFGGTSSAAPRVSGLFVLLADLFPDLSMISIRQCVLDTAIPFWQDPINDFDWIKAKAESAYGKRIFGKGRINPMDAYKCCKKIKKNMRKKRPLISTLDLSTSFKGP